MTVHAYLRVSSKAQADSGLGLEAQRSACEACVRARPGLGPAGEIRWHEDAGVSGATQPHARPALSALLGELRGGDVILVAKRDRLGRDSLALAMLEAYARKVHARILSAAGEGTESDEPHVVLMRRMIDAFSEYERLLIGARTRSALAALQARGMALGRAPYGWEYMGREEGQLEPIPDQQAVIGRALELRAEGANLAAAARRLNAEGFRNSTGGPFSNTQVKRMVERAAESGSEEVAAYYLERWRTLPRMG